jgi:hypothetical protein
MKYRKPSGGGPIARGTARPRGINAVPSAALGTARRTPVRCQTQTDCRRQGRRARQRRSETAVRSGPLHETALAAEAGEPCHRPPQIEEIRQLLRAVLAEDMAARNAGAGRWLVFGHQELRFRVTARCRPELAGLSPTVSCCRATGINVHILCP